MADTYTTETRTDGMGSPYQVRVPTPQIDPVISASDIGTRPLTIPPMRTPALTAADGTLKGLGASLAASAETSTQAENTAISDIKNLQNQLGTLTADQQALEANVGLPVMNKELADLQALQSQQLGGYLQNYNKLEQGGTGTIGGVSAAQTALQRSHAIDTLLTNSLIQAKQGNITAAQDSITKAIAAKYEPIKNRIENAKFILDQVKTKAATDRKNALDTQLKKIEKEEQNEKDIQDLAIEAAQNGAPNSVIQAISKSKNRQEALLAGSQFMSNPLDMELKKAQIAKAWADARKVDTTNGSLTEGQLKQIDNSPQGKKLTSLSGLYQLSQTYKNLVELHGFKAQGAEKAAIDRAYADLKIAYKTAAELGALTGPDVALIEEAVKPASGGGAKYIQYKLAGGKGGVAGAIDDGLTKARNEALKNYKQLTLRNPEYGSSEYVRSLIVPFAKDYSTVTNLKSTPAGEIIQTEDGTLLESLGNGNFSPI